jgi:type II secretory pathway component PulC
MDRDGVCGRRDGVRAIRPSSVFARLNFKNGDTVHAINGHELTGVDKVLEIVEQLKGVSELTFDISRRGAPLRLFVTITK